MFLNLIPIWWQNKDNRLSPLKKEDNTTPAVQKDEAISSRHHLIFNGSQLQWYTNGELAQSWEAISGNPYYQNRESISLANKGPLPEGTYALKKENLQNYDQSQTSILQQLKNIIGRGEWPGGKNSWGDYRLWLEPRNTTPTNRGNFSIHGGELKGSAGCVDLTKKMNEFAEKFIDTDENILLSVQYPRNF